MTQRELAQAKNPDLLGSLHAIKRAAAEARRIAIQTGTCLVIVQNGRTVRVSPKELREEAASYSIDKGTA